MTEDNPPLLLYVLEHLRAVCKAPLEVLSHTADGLVLQVGSNPEAVLGVRVTDSSRPAFCMSYPELRSRRDGRDYVQQATAEGVLLPAVEWAAGELAEHGLVRPEL